MPEPLDRDRIAALAGAAVRGVEVYASLPSTNRYLADAVRGQRILHPLAVLAEQQSAGVGRRGKAWTSPPGNISLSLLSIFDVPLARLSGLSLVTGVAVAGVLRQLYDLRVSLKWPNDVLLDGHKLAGLLVEVPSANSSRTCIVTGVGVNVLPPENPDIRQPVASLSEAVGEVDRNRLAGELIRELDASYRRFISEGIGPVLQQWRSLDYLHGREVNVLIGERTEQGLACGITENGELQVQIGDELRVFNSGDVSVRRR
ncbi:biotin--[acetyl-CoA-carboxylase] ligase [Granulosicoccaceae sp. 1_MG-2023]|nr:biotin--[acetyl-CoA-carboxylase] ligase [Granulosicoccaceae sp. 1_MG-2023]